MDSFNIQAVIQEYLVDLEKLVRSFNFSREGSERALGVEAAHLVAEGIVDRSATKQGGAGEPWRQNSATYTANKLAKYGVELIGFRTGQMISIPSLLGHVDIQPTRVEMRYGTNSPPTRSMTGHIEPADMRVTDNQKAEWFTDKKGEFYEVDENIADRVREHFASELDRFIGECNRKS